MSLYIQPSYDVEYFNRMFNHPEIAPFVRDDECPEYIDSTPLVDTPGNILLKLLVDGRSAGFAVMVLTGEHEYEMHSGMLPEFRGRTAVDFGRKIVEWMGDFGAKRLTTYAWENARHVRLMARAVGFEETGREDWPRTVNGQRVRRVNYAINYVEPFTNLTPSLETFLSPCL